MLDDVLIPLRLHLTRPYVLAMTCTSDIIDWHTVPPCLLCGSEMSSCASFDRQMTEMATRERLLLTQ